MFEVSKAAGVNFCETAVFTVSAKKKETVFVHLANALFRCVFLACGELNIILKFFFFGCQDIEAAEF